MDASTKDKVGLRIDFEVTHRSFRSRAPIPGSHDEEPSSKAFTRCGHAFPQSFWFLSSDMNTWTRLFSEQFLVLSAAVIPFINVTTSGGDFCSPGSFSSKRY